MNALSMLKSLFRKRYRRDPSKTDLENLALAFLHVFDDEIQWSWDDRSKTVVATFGSDEKNRVIDLLEDYFTDYWNIAYLDEVPDFVRQILARFEGIAPNQILFISEDKKGNFTFCAWWPWSDGEKTSIRLSLYNPMSTPQTENQLESNLFNWYRLESYPTRDNSL